MSDVKITGYVPYRKGRRREKTLYIAGSIILFIIIFGAAATSLLFTPLTCFSWIPILMAFIFVAYSIYGIMKGEIVQSNSPSSHRRYHRAVTRVDENPGIFGLVLVAYWFVASVLLAIGVVSLVLIIMYV